MKKSTLLSYLTAATVITTTAGTFAVWDSLETNATSTVSFRNPVTVTVNEEGLSMEVTENTLEDPIAKGTVKFEVKNEDGLASKIKLVPSASIGGSKVVTQHFDFEIIDTIDSRKTLVNESGSFTDNTLTSLEYEVKMTPKEELESQTVAELADQNITITLTATLE